MVRSGKKAVASTGTSSAAAAPASSAAAQSVVGAGEGKRIDRAGKGAGVGVVVKSGVMGKLVVSKVTEGGPAWSNGMIEVGDVLLRVDGRGVLGMRPEHLGPLVVGEPSTPVVLCFQARLFCFSALQHAIT